MRVLDMWVESDDGWNGTVIMRSVDGTRLAMPISMVRKKHRAALFKRRKIGGGWNAPTYGFECKIDDAGFILTVSKPIPASILFPFVRR